METVILAPSDYKKKIKRFFQNRPYDNVKVVTKEELEEALLYTATLTDELSYFEESSLPLSNLREILSSLTYLNIDKAKIIRPDLYDLYKRFTKESLKGSYYQQLFKRSGFYMIGYAKDDKEIAYLLKKLKVDAPNYISFLEELFEPEIIIKPVSALYLKFETVDDEVDYVFNKISSLIDNKIPPSSIKLLVCEESYLNYLKVYQQYYQLPLNNFEKENLLSIPKFLQTLNDVKEGIFDPNNICLPFEEVEIEFLSIYEKLEESGATAEFAYQYFVEYFRNRPLTKNYQNGIEIISSLSTCLSEDYVFLLGFSEKYPHYQADTNYLSNKMKEELSYANSTLDLNETEHAEFVKNVTHLPHLTVTFGAQSSFELFLESLSLDELLLKPTTPKYEKTRYSFKAAMNLLGTLYDKEKKYHYYDPREASLKESLSSFNYHLKLTTKADFQPFDFSLPSYYQLSYSKVQKFYECQFAFFIQYILKVTSDSESLSLILGSLAHRVLEKKRKGILEDNDKLLSEFEPLTASNRYFLLKLLKELDKAYEFHEKMFKSFGFTNYQTEVSSDLQLPDSLNLTGKIDLLMTSPDFIGVIDYKTGTPTYKSSLFPYGLNLQLPIYILMASKNNPDLKIAGAFLAPLFDEMNYFNETNDTDNLRLLGMMKAILPYDAFGLSSLYGEYFTLYSKVTGKLTTKGDLLTSENLKTLEEIVTNAIRVASDKIKEGDFIINPKKLKKTDLSCAFCSYQDICFKESSDYVMLNAFDDDEEDE